MVSTAPLLDTIAARLSMAEERAVAASKAATPNSMWAMASLMAPSTAVTANHVLPREIAAVTLHFDRWPSRGEVRGRVVARDEVVDFALLQIIESKPPDISPILTLPDPPADGSTWESLLIGPAAPEGVRVSGEVVAMTSLDGRNYLRLSPHDSSTDPSGMSGAPVIINGRLAGILARADDDGNWLAVPVAAMAEAKSPAGKIVRDLLAPTEPKQAAAKGEATAPTPAPEELDEAFFRRLGASSRRALGHGEGIRRARNQTQVHMEHLIIGLFQEQKGPARQALAAADIDEGVLRRLIADAVRVQIPKTWDRVDLTSFPPLSAHVKRALIEAREAAGASGSSRVQSSHLLYGALSVEDCKVARILLDRGVRKQDIELVPPTEQSPSRFDLKPRAVADQPTDEDTLDLKPLVDGLYSLLDSEYTNLPLAIAVTAPWGGGKSSVMKQLEKRLRNPPEGGQPYRRWHTVWFEAWKYEKSERLWAALAKAIYEQPQQEMNVLRRVLFRLRVEKRRQSLLTFLWKGLGPPLAAGAAATVTVAQTAIPDGAAPLLPVGTLVASIGRFWGVLSKPFKRAIDSYVKHPRSEDRLGFTPEADADVNNMIDALLSTSPPLEEKTGPLPPLARMWRAVERSWSPLSRTWAALRQITRDRWISIRRLWTVRLPVSGRPALIVFVDDLDRCNTRYVVEIVEAINQIFNATGGRECVFILGMDRDVVASSIDVAYSETISYLEKRHSPLAASFGLEFLAKLVQISVAIPRPETGTLLKLLADLTGNELPPDGSKPPQELVNKVKAAFSPAGSLPEIYDIEHRLREQALRGEGPGETGPSMKGEAAGTTTAPPAVRTAAISEAARQARARRLSSDSPEVWAAEREAIKWLGRNPRQVKRFDNAYRLQLYVASNSGRDLRFDPDELAILAKWVAIRLRWPGLAMAVDSAPELWNELEDYANTAHATRQIPDRWKDQYEAWFANQPLMDVLKERKKSRRLSKLSDTFLNVI